MSLNDFKIPESEVNTLNVKNARDTYNSKDVRSNKNIFDRLPEYIVGKFNALIDALLESGGPVKSEEIAFLKTNRDGDVYYSKDGKLWYAVSAAALKHKANKAEVYTKDETEKLVSDRVTQIGSADMTKAEYDTDNDGTVDNAKKLDGKGIEYFAQKVRYITINITAEGWSGNGPYKQDMAVEGLLESDRPILSAVPSEDDELARIQIENFGLLSSATADDGFLSVRCLDEKPSEDIPVMITIMR